MILEMVDTLDERNDVTLENAMVMLCHTAETRSEERPNRYTRAKKVGIYFLEAFLTSTTFKPANR